MEKTWQFLKLGLIGLCSLAFVGCIEQSVVVKVKKDGSGLVHERLHSAALFKDKEPTDILPSNKEIAAMEKRMGKGVKLKSARKTTNRKGWVGYDLIFEFGDINELTAFLDQPSKDAGSERELGDKVVEENDDKAMSYTFEMADGVLRIKQDLSHEFFEQFELDETAETDQTGGAVDPFAGDFEEDKSPDLASVFAVGLADAQTQMLAAMFKGAKMGFFVEVDGELEHSDAAHQKDNLVTLMSIDLGRFLQTVTKGGSLQGTAKSLEQLQDQLDTMDGLTADAKPVIEVGFK